MNLTLTVIGYVVITFLISFVLIYAYFLYRYQYWKKRAIPYLQPTFPRGNCVSFWGKIRGFSIDLLEINYDEMKKKGWKFGGFFTLANPVFLILDPEYAKDILTKDFHHFVDRGFYYKRHDEVSANLFVMDETNWKNTRAKLTPTFTSGKMKMMFPLIVKTSEQLVDHLATLAEKKTDIDMRECLAMFTTDVIVSCAFGLDSNCFTDVDQRFRSIGKAVFSFTSFTQKLKVTLMNYVPEMAHLLKIDSLKKEVLGFFSDVIASTIKYRKDNDVSRDDFLQLLIDFQENAKDSEKSITFEQLVAQVSIFFIAGFETSSSTMNFALYELAKNPDYQDKLIDEIFAALDSQAGELTYESVNGMKYLQKIVAETLRLYPVVSSVQRKCIKDYKLRDTNVIIEKGITVFISAISLHRDPKYFEDPLQFDPERFSNENKDKIVPYTYLPFGEGPRNCIGLRFGLMQTKIGLIQILRNFRLKISPSTIMPMRLDKERFILQPQHTVYLQAERIY